MKPKEFLLPTKMLRKRINFTHDFTALRLQRLSQTCCIGNEMKYCMTFPYENVILSSFKCTELEN